jgi:hypothetical protein
MRIPNFLVEALTASLLIARPSIGLANTVSYDCQEYAGWHSTEPTKVCGLGYTAYCWYEGGGISPEGQPVRSFSLKHKFVEGGMFEYTRGNFYFICYTNPGCRMFNGGCVPQG